MEVPPRSPDMLRVLRGDNPISFLFFLAGQYGVPIGSLLHSLEVSGHGFYKTVGTTGELEAALLIDLAALAWVFAFPRISANLGWNENE